MSDNNSSLGGSIALKQLQQVGDVRAQQLADAGFASVTDVKESSPVDIMSNVEDIGSARAKTIFSSAHELQTADTWTFSAGLLALDQVGAQRAQTLADEGFETVSDVAASSPADIAEELDMGNLSGWVATQVFSSAHQMLEDDDEMRVVIAGSRGLPTDLLDREEIVDYVDNAVSNAGFEVSEVVSGGAEGADRAGEIWADEMGIPVRTFEPNWDEHPDAGGWLRNQYMANYADAVVALWDGSSNGTADMVGRGLGEFGHKRVYVYRTDEDEGRFPDEYEFADDIVDIEAVRTDNSDDDDEPDARDSPSYRPAPESMRNAERLAVVLDSDDYTKEEARELIANAVDRHQLRATHIGVPDSADGQSLTTDWFWAEVNMGGSRFGFNPKEETARDHLWTFGIDRHTPSDVFTGDHPDDKDDDQRWKKEMESHEWGDTFEALREEVLAWATHVLVIDGGDFSFMWERKADDLNVVHKTHATDDNNWSPDDVDRQVAPDISELDAKHGAQEGTRHEREHDDDMAPDRDVEVETGEEEFNQWEGDEADTYAREGNGPGDDPFIV